MTRQTNIRLPDVTLDQLTEIERRTGLNRKEAIIVAVDRFVCEVRRATPERTQPDVALPE